MRMLYPSHKSIKFYIRRLWDTQKNIEAEEKWALKKEEHEKKIRKNKLKYFMNVKTSISKVRSLSIWIFIVPFISINLCLILTVYLHCLPGGTQCLDGSYTLIPKEFRLYNTFPYFDGGASISRTARFLPNSIIFKLSMFFTSFCLIKYWLYNKKIIIFLNNGHKYTKKIIFFGIFSAVMLALHSAFLGFDFNNDFYKLFRRVVLLSFIIFEIVAQTYLVLILYSIKDKLTNLINFKILKLKLILVSILIAIAVFTLPFLNSNSHKLIKHALEWNYFIGVIGFYFLTFLMWKNNKKN
jgi:hypothetical protein